MHIAYMLEKRIHILLVCARKPSFIAFYYCSLR